jgi:CRP-like cAMP-binding protein
LAAGQIDVLRQVRGTRAECLNRMRPGDLFGVNALILRSARTASCVAATAGWAYRLPAEASEAMSGEAALWWNECLLKGMETQLRLASAALSEKMVRPTASKPPSDEAELETLLRRSGFLEGLPAGVDLDQVEVVEDEDRRRNPRRKPV